MAEYIERDKVMDALLHEQYGYLCEDSINSIPAADVVPVVRGKWLHKEITDDFHVVGQCSVCKERRRIDNFCPNCGADMREES